MNSRKKTGFTLIELLFVIVILGILLGLLSTALIRSRENSQKSRENTDKSTLASAVYAYRTEYGRWPCAAMSGTNVVYSSDNYLVREYMEGELPHQNPRKVKFVNWSEYTFTLGGVVVSYDVPTAAVSSPRSLTPYLFRLNLTTDTVKVE